MFLISYGSMGHEFRSSLNGQFLLQVSHDVVVRCWSRLKSSEFLARAEAFKSKVATYMTGTLMLSVVKRPQISLSRAA